MREISRRLQLALSYVLTVILIASYPAASFAETIADPSPAAAPTPTNAVDPNYTYDTATGRWNSDKWRYNGSTGQYGPVSTPGPVSPTGPTSAPGPKGTIAPVSGPTVVEAPTGSESQDSGTNGAAGSVSSSQSDPQPSGTTSTTDTSSVTTGINSATNNTIKNNLGSDAASGDTAVTSNTNAGNATSGGASVAQTVINTINSSVSGNSGSGVANFVADITGDVYGDMILSPMMLGAMLSNAVLNSSASSNTTMNTANDNQITNNIDLNATTGSATVSGNTNAGNATTGTANAVANVMNIINSIIAANQSFVGTINIYGNLDGDILIAPDFLPQLLASNGSNSQSTDSSLTVNLNDTQTIANNVNLSALSGDATVAGNTSAGSATTGAAGTKLTILNLTGHDVVASNSLLVFVNVLGKWVGVIVDAPAGATAAAIGNGVTQNTIADATSTVNSQNNTQITNNINIASQSGDASVAHNTNAGNATSGDATASANILNMSQSSFGVSGWFGILFINVFGQWLGDLLHDSARGDPQQPVAGNTQELPVMPVSDTPQAVAFVAKPPTLKATVPVEPEQSQSVPVPLSTVSDISAAQPLEVQNDQIQPRTVGVRASSQLPPTSTSSSPGLGSNGGVAMLGAALLVASSLRFLWPLVSKRFR